MPYLLSLERMARDQEREEGRERQAELLLKLLQLKLNGVPAPLERLIRELTVEQLTDLGDRALEMESWPQVLESLLVKESKIQELGAQAEFVQPSVLVQILQAYWGDVDEDTQRALGQLSVAQVRELATLIVGWQERGEFTAWLS